MKLRALYCMFIALLQRNVSSERRTKWEKKERILVFGPVKWKTARTGNDTKRMRKPEPSSVQYNQKVN